MIAFFCNLMTPLWADDFCRLHPFSLVQPLVLAWRDYFDWTGRFFVTAITYYVMALGDAWSMVPFDLLNAAMFTALVLQVLALARLAVDRGRGLPQSALDLAFTALLVWWLPRGIAEVALWKTGSIGYLWAVTGELWLLRIVLDGAQRRRRWHAAPAFVIATFLEPISALVSVLLLSDSVRGLLKRGLLKRGLLEPGWRRREPAPLLVSVAHGAGTLLLLAAPGNFVRAATLPRSPMLDRLTGVVGNLGSLFDPLWAVAVAVIILAHLPERTGHAQPGSDHIRAPRPSHARTLRFGHLLAAGQGWVFAALAVAFMAILIGVPRAALSARTTFPASLFLVLYLVSVFINRPRRDGRIRTLAVCLVAATLLHLMVVVPDVLALRSIAQTWAADPHLRDGPDAAVTLQQFRVHGRLVYARKDMFFEGLTADPNYFVNICFAKAMRVRSVVAKP